MKLNKLTQSLGRFFRIQHNENLQMIEDEVNQLHQDDITTNARIDNLVLNTGGDDITQVIDALVDRKGTPYPTLHNLLTTKDQEYADMFAKAQMSKITSDNGEVKYTLANQNDDLLSFIADLPSQMFTIYVNATVQNKPSVNPGKGIGHISTEGNGWIFYYDTKGDIFHNQILNTKWTGWERVVKESEFKQEILWSGAAYLVASTTYYPTRKLSECKNGWILVWSDYDPGVGPNNYNWATTVIPKRLVAEHSDSGHCMVVPTNIGRSEIITKYAYITDSSIKGHPKNSSEDILKDVCLRYVLSF